MIFKGIVVSAFATMFTQAALPAIPTESSSDCSDIPVTDLYRDYEEIHNHVQASKEVLVGFVNALRRKKVELDVGHIERTSQLTSEKLNQIIIPLRHITDGVIQITRQLVEEKPVVGPPADVLSDMFRLVAHLRHSSNVAKNMADFADALPEIRDRIGRTRETRWIVHLSSLSGQ